jgi:tRNA (guanine10-N2)-methyltransferase
MMKYLASFVRKDTFFDFCLPELISVCEMYNIPLKYDSDFSFDIKNDPLIFIDIPNSSEFAQKICDRSVLTKYIIEVISSGKTYDDLIEKINKEDFLSESSSLETFKFEVDPRGKVMSQDEKLDVIEKFHILNFKGKVNLKNPKRVFIVIENDHTGIKYFGKLLAGKSQGNILYNDIKRVC